MPRGAVQGGPSDDAASPPGDGPDSDSPASERFCRASGGGAPLTISAPPGDYTGFHTPKRLNT